MDKILEPRRPDSQDGDRDRDLLRSSRKRVDDIVTIISRISGYVGFVVALLGLILFIFK